MFGIISDAHLFNKYAIEPEKYHNIIINEFKNCDFIVDCGDLTDKSNLTAPQIDILSKIFTDVNKPIYLLAGNHDSLANTTVASIFEENKNIKVIKAEPKVIDGMLFIPYTDDIKNLYKILNKIVTTPVKYAFSHLNITNNFYSSINSNNIHTLFNYTEYLFNGHIHLPEILKESVIGTLYNVGSCSSLTYGDVHIPNFCIFDKDKLQSNSIRNSIIHKTYDITEDNFDTILSLVEEDAKNNRLCCRFRLYNNESSIEIRRKIREVLQDVVYMINFDYIKNKTKVNESIEKTSINKEPLIELLIKSFEKENRILLSKQLKEELI